MKILFKRQALVPESRPGTNRFELQEEEKNENRRTNCTGSKNDSDHGSGKELGAAGG